MTRFLFFFLFILFSSVLKSQCFQIQSILVDACDGPNEGKNEMVVFKVGSTALNTANLSVNWPNNTWLGLTKNASTATDVATVNATIDGCGLLKEPIAGVLPANSKVLLVTSTAWTPLAQSFVNLNDTLYVIFQTAGNTAGHFANYQSGGGLRTLTMTFSVPASCTDAVTYDRALLTNQAGNIGAQDGGDVEFTSAGVPSYVNHGCQAPFIPLSVDAGSNKTICLGASQNFSATTSGAYTSINWSLGAGATGTFVSSNSVTTIYNPGAGDNGTIKLYVTITKSCGAQTTSVKDSVNLTVTPTPTLIVDFSNISLCTGQTATVTATSSEGNYLWTPGSTTTNTLLVNSAGIYTITTSNNCYTTTATSSVTINGSPTLSISSTSSSLCASGQTAILSLSGSTGVYNWSDGTNASTTVVNTPGVYTATVSTPSCGSMVSSFTIVPILTPSISLSSSSSLLCNGATATLTASSNMFNEVWSNGLTNVSSIVVGSAGIYTVGVSNACGSPTVGIPIQANTTPVLVLTPSSTLICPNETATLTVTGGSAPYVWSNSSNTGSIVTSNGGTVTVSNTNACGTSTAVVIVNVTNLNADVVANPTSGVLPVVVSFTNNSSNANSYTWNFGNGNSANTSTVSSQTYSVAGTYTVYLTATNGSCSDTDSLVIIVLNEEPSLVIPNVFTPNGDSINDIFRVSGKNISEFSCTIFDRWGLQMYYWNDIKGGWNGKTDGKEVPAGTYFYIINAKSIDDKEIKKQGYLNLFK